MAKKINKLIKTSKLFLDKLVDPIFITDENLIIEYVNKSFLEKMNYSEEEIIGKMNCGDLLKTPFCNTDKCTIKSSMRQNKPITGITTAKDREGHIFPIRAVSNHIIDKKGNVIGGFETIADITTIDDGFLNNMADAAFRTDKNLTIQNINDSALKTLGYSREEVIGKMNCGDFSKTPLCGTANCTIKRCMDTKSTVTVETEAKTKNGEIIPLRAACGVLLDTDGNPTGGFEILSDNSDFIQMSKFAEIFAEGDLTAEIDKNILKKESAVGELARSLNRMKEKLSDAVSEIKFSSEELSIAVDQISGGNQELAQRTSEQASSLEEVASTIEEFNSSIKQNTENSVNAGKLADETTELAATGGQVVGEAAVAINDMNESSKKIEEIISVLNEITFQTNLLALNAAVEAARAGEQGRGFAVVAGEVRNLAQRSSEAAKEIGVLIKETLEKVDRSTTLANKSGESLTEIVEATKKVNRIISEIVAGSEEQNQGADQIGVAITELDTMTQQNAALVEETASASEEMAGQAHGLLEIMQTFKVNEKEKRTHTDLTKKVSKTADLHKIKTTKENKPPKVNDKEPMVLKDDGFEEF